MEDKLGMCGRRMGNGERRRGRRLRLGSQQNCRGRHIESKLVSVSGQKICKMQNDTRKGKE